MGSTPTGPTIFVRAVEPVESGVIRRFVPHRMPRGRMWPQETRDGPVSTGIVSRKIVIVVAGDGAGWICTRLSAETKRDRNPSSPPRTITRSTFNPAMRVRVPPRQPPVARQER